MGRSFVEKFRCDDLLETKKKTLEEGNRFRKSCDEVMKDMEENDALKLVVIPDNQTIDMAHKHRCPFILVQRFSDSGRQGRLTLGCR